MEHGNQITCSVAPNKREVVEYFYLKENDYWHENIHKRGGAPKENIDDTLGSISENSIMFLVEVGNEKAGFFVRYENGITGLCLEGFHVGKEFRKKEFFFHFWKLVSSVFEYTFFTGIYCKNYLAINHLIKNGFIIDNKIVHEGKEYIIFKYIK